MASILRVNTLTDASSNNSTAMSTINQGTAKAWMHFDGTGTVAIDRSFNISTLEDVAGGQYAGNFTSNMSYADYPNTGHGRHDGGVNALFSCSTKDSRPPITTRCGIDTFSSDGTQTGTDCDQVSQLIHGDLA